jgi:hypothetical protein
MDHLHILCIGVISQSSQSGESFKYEFWPRAIYGRYKYLHLTITFDESRLDHRKVIIPMVFIRCLNERGKHPDFLPTSPWPDSFDKGSLPWLNMQSRILQKSVFRQWRPRL